MKKAGMNPLTTYYYIQRPRFRDQLKIALKDYIQGIDRVTMSEPTEDVPGIFAQFLHAQYAKLTVLLEAWATQRSRVLSILSDEFVGQLHLDHLICNCCIPNPSMRCVTKEIAYFRPVVLWTDLQSHC